MFKNIPVKKLVIDPANFRPKPDVTQMFEENVCDRGLLQPLIVRHRGGGKYGVIVGARRLIAARNVGLKEVPCDVRRIKDDMEAKAISFAENVHREDIPAWRKRELIREFYDATDKRKSRENRVKEVMSKLNLTRTKIQQYLSLDDLPDDFKARLKKPRERSESEKKLLERMPVLASVEKAPIAKRSAERAPSRVEPLGQIPQQVAVKLARSNEFLELAESDPKRAHKIATRAAEVGRERMDEEILQPLRQEMREVKKPPKVEFEGPKPAVMRLSMRRDIMDALEEYADGKNITPKTAVRSIIQGFLISKGYLEPY